RLFASPRARMRARTLGVDLNGVRGSGPNGRIVEADVLSVGAPVDASRVLATPMARRVAQEHGVAITELVGSGPGGRITQDDVLRATTVATPPAAVAPGAAASVAVAPGAAAAGVELLSRLRRITAERMAASVQATA